MTAPELDQYLAVLKAHGVASAHLKLPNGEAAVVFGPDPLPAGTETTPGGWKGPDRLDVLAPDSEVP
jgi:hypothetical protein